MASWPNPAPTAVDTASSRSQCLDPKSRPSPVQLDKILTTGQVQDLVDRNHAMCESRKRDGDRKERRYRRELNEKASWPEPDPNQAFPTRATAVVIGIPWGIEEKELIFILMTAFGQWEMGHEDIVARNSMRESGDGKRNSNRWQFPGKAYLRFRSQQLCTQYIADKQGTQFANPGGTEPRRVTCQLADTDLTFKEHDYPSGPQYFSDCWVTSPGIMEKR